MAKGKIFDVAVIGAGASGLSFCAYLFEHNKSISICLLDKEKRVGKRILSTGGGRCNITNTSIAPKDYRGSGARYIDALLSEYTSKKLRDELFSLGIITREDECGRVYPYSEQASSVLDALRLFSEGFEKTECNILSVKKKEAFFEIETDREIIKSRYLLLSTGGCVSKSLGSDGSGYRYARMLGHTVTKVYPSLAPIKVKSSVLSALKGIRVSCKVSLLRNGNAVISEYGELQFNDDALSGICVFQLSPFVNEELIDNKHSLTVSLDLMPEYDIQEVYNILRQSAYRNRDKTMETLFVGLLNRRLGQQLLKQEGYKSGVSLCSELSSKALIRLASKLKDWRFTPQAVSDVNKAQVTSGGIIGDEIDFRTMKSKKVDKLYFAGEIIDVDGKCGGYNLHFAFSTGIRCAKSIIEEIENDKNK